MKHNIAPSLFTQSGFLVREDITPPSLAALLGKTAATDQDDAWKAIAQPQIEAAKTEVSQRYQALTLPVAILGVFMAYLAAGLLPYQMLASLHERFSGIQNWLNPIFAGLAPVAAALSFRDGFRARRGRMG